MLKNSIKRSIFVVAAFVMFLALIPHKTLADNLATDAAVTINTTASSRSFSNDAASQEIQAEIDALMEHHHISNDMAAEAIEASVADMDYEYREALNDVMLLEEQLADAVSSDKLTEDEALTLAESNPAFCTFAQALQNKYAADNSISYLDTTVTVLDGKISVTGSSTTSVSGSTVTIQAKGGLLSQTTNNVTVTNSSGSTATISFNYSASNYSSFTNPDGAATASGTKTVTLAAGGTVTMSIKGKRAISSNTATLTLNEFSLVAAAASSNVTFEYSGGGITVNGNALTSTTMSIPSSGAALVATPSSGYSFLGWIDGSNSILSKTNSFTLTPANDMTVQAVFAKSDGTDTAWFLAGGDRMYDDLNDAASYASTANTKTVILLNSGTLSSSANETNGVYTIPAGVTLLIPFNDTNTCYTTEPAYYNPGSAEARKAVRAWNVPETTAYRTLTMEDGASITVNGNISVSGQHMFMGPWSRPGSSPVGPQGMINMLSGSSMTVNNGGNLYAWGYVYGAGTITVNSGGNVYELFQVADYPGGAQAVKMEHEAFPFSQWYVQNIEVQITLNSGASEYVYVTVYVPTPDSDLTTMLSIFPQTIKFIGSSNALFNMTSGTMVKDYDETTDRLKLTQKGDMTLGSISLNFGTTAGTISSSNYILPFTPSVSYTVESGNATMGNKVSVLPGAEIIIKDGTTTTMSSVAYVYDLDNWGNYVQAYTGVDKLGFIKVKPLDYTPSNSYRRTAADLKDAMVQVDGTLEITGAGYTTTGGANICSTGTGKIIATVGEETLTYWCTNYDAPTYAEIPITPAKLKNGDGTYTETTGASSTTYKYINGFWHSGGACTGGTATCSKKAVCTICKQEYGDLANHSYNSVVTAPTCTDKGYTTHTCTVCGDSYTDSEMSANGHTEVTDAAVAPTCTATGLTEGSHCSVCSEVIVAQTVVAANGHSYGEGVITTQPTVDAEGVKTYTCTVCGDTKTEAVPALTAVAKIGDTKYASLAAAISAASNGGKITLLANTDEVITADRCLVINKNGFNASNITAGSGLYLSTTGAYIAVVKGFTLVSAECAYDAEVVLRIKFYIPDEFKDGGYNIALHKDGRWEDHAGNDRSFAVNDMNPAEKDSLYWSHIGVASGEMGRDVTVKVLNSEGAACTLYYANGNEVGQEFTYTVQNYIQSGLTAFANDEKRLAAVKAMAVYGGYAQKYFEVDPEAPVWSVLNESDAALTGVGGVKEESINAALTVQGSAEGIQVKSLEPFLDSATYLRVKFILDSDAKLEDYTFKVTGPDGVEMTLKAAYESESGRYYVDIPDIPAAYWDNEYTVTVNDTYSVTVSVMLWAKNVISKSADADQVAMARALYLYGSAASALFDK